MWFSSLSQFLPPSPSLSLPAPYSFPFMFLQLEMLRRYSGSKLKGPDPPHPTWAQRDSFQEGGQIAFNCSDIFLCTVEQFSSEDCKIFPFISAFNSYLHIWMTVL